jgi:WD40-like Beta Propeller Repeat
VALCELRGTIPASRPYCEVLSATPVNLPAPINTSANDGAPSLARDRTTLYFDSTRAGGLGGRDLVVSTREKF